MLYTFVSFKTKVFIGIVALFFLVGLANIATVSASTTSNYPGSVEGQDTRFDITDSAYINISLTSSETINAYVESIPNTITVAFSASETAASTDISISGLTPLTTYYKYQDDYSSLQILTTDENGTLEYIQDVSEQHIAFIQTVRSTKFINNNAQGGDCSSIGTWDQTTLTCTLGQDVNETIQINASNATLDGAGHTVNGSYTGNGIYLNAPGVTVKNLTVQHFSSGLAALSTAIIGTRVDNVTAIANTIGFNIRSAIDTVVVNSNFTNNSNYGIFIGWYYAGQPSRNTQVYNNNFQGNYISDISASSSTSTGTTLSLDPPIGGNYFDHYDTTAEGCVDGNGDGMCDSPWNVGSGFYDNHPWTSRNGWLTPPTPDTRRLVKVAIVPVDVNDVNHNSSPINAQPCKLLPQKTYQGHSKEYFDDIAFCIKDYYRENLFDTAKFDFDFIGDGQWFKGAKNEIEYVNHEADLANEALAINGYNPEDYNIVVVVHAGTSRQLSNNGNNKISTQAFRGLKTTQVVLLSEEDRLGGWVHEIGHALGAISIPGNDALTPDLYNMGDVGDWDVMANGSWNGDRNDPPNMSSYTKQYFGLLNEDIHPLTDYGTHWINSLETSIIGGNIFRYNLVDNQLSSTPRYYLVEARNKDIGVWDSSAPTKLLQSKNLVLYYVDTKNAPAYGYDSAGRINNESRTVTIPGVNDITPIPNSGVLSLGNTYRDLDDMVKFKAVTDSTADQKYQIQVDIQPINPNGFVDPIYGVVLRGQNLILSKLGSKITLAPYRIDPKAGSQVETYTGPTVWDKIFQPLARGWYWLIADLLWFFIITGLGLWAVKKILSKTHKYDQKIKKFLPYFNWLFLAAKISAVLLVILTIVGFLYTGLNYRRDRAYPVSRVSSDEIMNIPGTDLHAYCPGGKHIGMNYETREFENQIEGSIVSGSNGGAPEWIYVPANVTGCRFFVSSERNKEYIDAHPEIDTQTADASDSYELYSRYIDPQAGIFTSTTLTDQIIEPGVMMEHAVSGTGADISVASGAISDPNEPAPLFCPSLQQNVTYTSMAPAMECAFTNGPKTLQLKDSACNSISGARVNVRKANGAYLTYVLTNADGLADLSGYSNPDASYFEVDYHGATYSTGGGTFSTGTGAQTHPYELSLKGSDCNPITGARVNLRKADGSYVTYAMTNASGNSSFEVVPNASMKLEADYHGGTWMSESRNPDTNITLGTDKFAIRLSDSSGGAISNARVNLRKDNNAYVMYATTGDNGLASFEVLPNVPLLLEVDYHGAVYRTASSATHEELKITTIPFGVHLLDSNGAPIAGARVNLRKADSSYVTHGLTNADGAASFEVVPGAQMKLEVDYHGATYSTDTFDAATNPSTTIQTKLLGLVFLASTGEPIVGARINLRKADGSYVTYATTSADGKASFEVVPHSQMKLEIDYHGSTYLTGALDADTTPLTSVSAYALSLELKDSAGNIIPNARVNLRKADNSYVTYVLTDGEGIASFQVVPAATMILEANYNGGTYATAATVVSGDTTLHIQTSPITVHLTAQGQPLVNMRGDLLNASGAYVTYAMTNAAGDLAFEVLPGAPHMVRTTYGGTTWVSDIVMGGADVTKNF